MPLAVTEAPVARSRILPRQASPGMAPAVPLIPACSGCHLRCHCLPRGLGDSDVARLDGLMFARRKVKSAQTLYLAGEHFEYIYAVHRGIFKSSLPLADGREQVSGFYMAGELMGLDGAAHGSHASSATALEDTEVCAIPYTRLTEFASGNAGMQRLISRLMSREIVRGNSHMLLSQMNAEERLAKFLMNLSQRLKARGYSASEFHLRMTRAEIGSYLCMTLETVSRTFSALQLQHLLEVDNRRIRIIDPDALKRLFENHVHRGTMPA